MSSLRWQRMCSWDEFQKLENRIRQSVIGHKNKIRLLTQLQEGGKAAVPDVAREFKQIKKQGTHQ